MDTYNPWVDVAVLAVWWTWTMSVLAAYRAGRRSADRAAWGAGADWQRNLHADHRGGIELLAQPAPYDWATAAPDLAALEVLAADGGAA